MSEATNPSNANASSATEDVDIHSRESVFDWNNQASAHLQRGDFRTAASMYLRIVNHLDRITVKERSARRSLRSLMRSHPGVACVSDDEDDEEDDEEDDLEPPLTLLSVPIGSDLAGPTIAVDATEPFALYNQTFITAYREQSQVTRDANGKKLVAALVRFNLGLCVQFKEGQGPEHNPAMLRGARQSYASSLRFLDQYQEQGSTEDALFLTLAIYNNLGHLYHRLGDLEEARRCSSHIQFLIRTRGTVHFPMNPNDWAFFSQTSIMREQAQALIESRPTLVV